MQNHKSVVCNYYNQRINDEIAAGEFSADRLLVYALKNNFVTSESKASLGIPHDYPLSMHDVLKKSVETLPRIRFIYLLSLLEAFFQEYICERDGIQLTELKSNLVAETSIWSKRSNNSSSSFYHIPYVSFILKSKYQIDLSSKLEKISLEMGTLRNCIVHHDGKVITTYLLNGLSETIAFQNKTVSLNDTVQISKKLMAKYIQESQKIISLLDYLQ